MDALRVSMEQRLNELLDEADRLRAALAVLGPGDTDRLSASRPQRTATRRVVVKARADEPAVSVGEVARATRSARAAATAEVASSGGEGSSLVVDRADGLAHQPAGTPGGELATPMTGAERALQSLRRELAGGLRTRQR